MHLSWMNSFYHKQNEIESVRLNVPTYVPSHTHSKSESKQMMMMILNWWLLRRAVCAVFSVLFSLNAHHTFVSSSSSYFCLCGYYCCCSGRRCQYCFCKRILLVDYINSDGQLFGSAGMIGVFDIGALRSLTFRVFIFAAFGFRPLWSISDCPKQQTNIWMLHWKKQSLQNSVISNTHFELHV